MNHVPRRTPIDRDEADDDLPMDPDISLLADYLARELTLRAQYIVEAQIKDDAALRRKVRLLIDLWFLQVSFDDGSLLRLVKRLGPSVARVSNEP